MQISTSEHYPNCTIVAGHEDSVEHLQNTVSRYLEEGYGLIHFSAILMKPESPKQIKATQSRGDKKTPAKRAKTCELRGDEEGSVTGTECRGFKFKGKTYEVPSWNRLVLSLCRGLAENG